MNSVSGSIVATQEHEACYFIGWCNRLLLLGPPHIPSSSAGINPLTRRRSGCEGDTHFSSYRERICQSIGDVGWISGTERGTAVMHPILAHTMRTNQELHILLDKYSSVLKLEAHANMAYTTIRLSSLQDSTVSR